MTSAYDLSDRVSLCGGDYDGFGCGKVSRPECQTRLPLGAVATVVPVSC